LLSNPVVLDPIPRNQRDNYIAPTQSSADLTVPPEHYEYEYTQPRLVYSFDQSVFGVDNLSHVLTSLYQVRQKRGQRQKRGHHSLSRQKPKKNETEHK
jgi:hypothetical protein